LTPAKRDSPPNQKEPQVSTIIKEHSTSGLYVLGLAYQYRRSTHFIGGVGRDAQTIARRILASRGPRRRRVPVPACAA
jgi:hypothetical protein